MTQLSIQVMIQLFLRSLINSFPKNSIDYPLSYRVLLRVRMLYYIKHEIIGDLVQHINDGVHVR